jgi:hypothetical protein
VPLLPVLESSYQLWLRNLDEVHHRSPLIGESIESAVDIPALLAAALRGDGEYWPSLALGWLEASPSLPLPREALIALAEARRTRPQALRHRARALLGRYSADM